MKEAFEKIKERVCEFIHERNKSGSVPCKNQRASCLQLIRVCDLTTIVNQVAEEYGKDTNVHSNEFDTIYNKVLKLEKQYAKVEGNMEAVNDCIRLENLLQYFKEELQSEVEE